ncbi:hypothetical protein [Novosphingobium sp.]|uniref:hypothetical protein n=1 Tax=Novosphingobium sp. TaxID=1874826 RepID=UPI0032B713DF
MTARFEGEIDVVFKAAGRQGKELEFGEFLRDLRANCMGAAPHASRSAPEQSAILRKSGACPS